MRHGNSYAGNFVELQRVKERLAYETRCRQEICHQFDIEVEAWNANIDAIRESLVHWSVLSEITILVSDIIPRGRADIEGQHAKIADLERKLVTANQRIDNQFEDIKSLRRCIQGSDAAIEARDRKISELKVSIKKLESDLRLARKAAEGFVAENRILRNRPLPSPHGDGGPGQGHDQKFADFTVDDLVATLRRDLETANKTISELRRTLGIVEKQRSEYHSALLCADAAAERQLEDHTHLQKFLKCELNYEERASSHLSDMVNEFHEAIQQAVHERNYWHNVACFPGVGQ